MQFVRDERGRPAGAEGCHDDIVLSSAIAQYCRLVLLGYFSPEVTKKERYGDTPLEEAEDEEIYDGEEA
jgi:hypothetical protein